MQQLHFSLYFRVLNKATGKKYTYFTTVIVQRNDYAKNNSSFGKNI